MFLMLEFSGSPAQFSVVDPANVTVRGDGLGLVQCSRQAVFAVCAPAAQLTDIDIAVIGLCFVQFLTLSHGGVV